jgi:hypothetical protein
MEKRLDTFGSLQESYSRRVIRTKAVPKVVGVRYVFSFIVLSCLLDCKNTTQ